MQIEDGVLVTSVTSQLRSDSSNRFSSQRLISGVIFVSVPLIVFKRWREGGGVFDAPPQSRECQKAQSE